MTLGETFPDVEGALKDLLRTDADVLASPAGARTYLALPDDPSFPCVTVLRIAGGEDTGEAPVDVALVQVDIWGRVKRLSQSDEVRLAVRRALSKVRQRTPVTGKAVLWGATVRDDRRFPTPQAQDSDGAIGERPRYILTVQVTATQPDP